ncbi:uncharacterized protein BJ212DRAFT_1477733 [Suillus subaureus]|uniref:Uncharacterized protein n=1 Tax=Suillus subaureus TaxID=48587 RepID=A0A9P7DMV4_9AGAM|nr:uncharacterized protein BJ212DRAFT_1488589 [Suillus subaureus]XP_041196643.1 uncharacterized protein BJ212DRAFT_1477733 [Suillus subaureus]KAG1798673.1 hypothetical protein BJ212DRAFT_1488589 [Suillus subaureus]KAG1821903.1 hypothetical protein BJ212DRAFT_1477733 [Suillus subaureus]
MTSSITTSGLKGWTPVFLNAALISSVLFTMFPLPLGFLLCPASFQPAEDNNVKTLVNMGAMRW